MIIGFVSIDFITFPDPENLADTLFLATGLDCFLNNYTSMLFFLDVVSDIFSI